MQRMAVAVQLQMTHASQILKLRQLHHRDRAQQRVKQWRAPISRCPSFHALLGRQNLGCHFTKANSNAVFGAVASQRHSIAICQEFPLFTIA